MRLNVLVFSLFFAGQVFCGDEPSVALNNIDYRGNFAVRMPLISVGRCIEVFLGHKVNKRLNGGSISQWEIRGIESWIKPYSDTVVWKALDSKLRLVGIRGKAKLEGVNPEFIAFWEDGLVCIEDKNGAVFKYGSMGLAEIIDKDDVYHVRSKNGIVYELSDSDREYMRVFFDEYGQVKTLVFLDEQLDVVYGEGAVHINGLYLNGSEMYGFEYEDGMCTAVRSWGDLIYSLTWSDVGVYAYKLQDVSLECDGIFKYDIRWTIYDVKVTSVDIKTGTVSKKKIKYRDL